MDTSHEALSSDIHSMNFHNVYDARSTLFSDLGLTVAILLCLVDVSSPTEHRQDTVTRPRN